MILRSVFDQHLLAFLDPRNARSVVTRVGRHKMNLADARRHC